jgi:outer membrane protein assembly factor BamD (BamD/ComL family)
MWGCTHLLEKRKGEKRVARARTLLAEGKCRASLKEIKEVLRLYPRNLGDKALFQMGLIYACPKNPDHDYPRSLKCFQRVIKEFPQSKIRNQAKVWILFVQELINKEKEIGRLKKTNSHLVKALNKDKVKVKELESQVEKLKDQLLRLKEIDLGIEERKSHAK